MTDGIKAGNRRGVQERMPTVWADRVSIGLPIFIRKG